MNKRRGVGKDRGKKTINWAKIEKKRKKTGPMGPVAQHKPFIHFKRIPCKTVESHHISIRAGTAAYHAYRCTITASASLSTGCFSLGQQPLIMFKQRKIKENLMQNLLHSQVPHDRSQSNERQDSTYCSVPFSCLSGRRNKVNNILTAGTHLSKHLDIAIAVASRRLSCDFAVLH